MEAKVGVDGSGVATSIDYKLTHLDAGNITAGTLAINRGGTGQVTANAAFNALAPSQAGASGKFLTSNGTDTSWATVTVPATKPLRAGG